MTTERLLGCWTCLREDSYESFNCCEPGSGWQFANYATVMLINSLFIGLFLSAFICKNKKSNLRLRICDNGIAIQAIVIGKNSKLTSTNHRGEETFEHYVRIEFVNTQGRIVIKDAEVQQTEQWDKMFITSGLTIHHLPESPSSALVDVQTLPPESEACVELVFLSLMLGGMYILIFGFLVFHIFDDFGLGSLRSITLILYLLPVTVLFSWCFASHEYMKYEGSILCEEVCAENQPKEAGHINTAGHSLLS